MKKIAVLGSTGSIGTQTLEVVRAQKDIEVTALAAGSNITRLEEQIREFHPEIVCVWEEEKAKELALMVSDLPVKVVCGMDGLIAAAVETDAELRRRQAISTALPSLTVFEGTLGAVASIPGVTRSRGYENDGGLPDADGIPAHSICMVVEGGDTAAIAEAIAAKKGPGAGTYGTTEALVRDKYGVPNVIKFFRPAETPVYATVTIRPFPGYLSTTGESIRKNVAEHINGLNIGDDVSLSRLYSPANAANAASYDIESITLGTSQGAQSAANVAVAFNAVASCSVDRVKLVVRP